MSNELSVQMQKGLEQAFQLCTHALDILDGCGAPDSIGLKLQEVIETVLSTLAEISDERN